MLQTKRLSLADLLKPAVSNHKLHNNRVELTDIFSRYVKICIRELVKTIKKLRNTHPHHVITLLLQYMCILNARRALCSCFTITKMHFDDNHKTYTDPPQRIGLTFYCFVFCLLYPLWMRCCVGTTTLILDQCTSGKRWLNRENGDL